MDEDPEQLWRRIVLFVCVSNTDDRLRNTGFLLAAHGSRLALAYDLDLVLGVAELFRPRPARALDRSTAGSGHGGGG